MSVVAWPNRYLDRHSLVVGQATGQSRESAMAVMGKPTKIVFIVMIATSLAANGAPLHKTLTQNLDKEL
ncbi:hypothetical protein NXZ69_18565, partial [Xanthomonas hortorum pv. pelargonii]|nr:hypothetical protein [Xanthomonas hortorum pv. pelargonii]MCU1714873.1 hypothetical protein [Xanthomonas hortorum pv. pelargonii]